MTMTHLPGAAPTDGSPGAGSPQGSGNRRDGVRLSQVATPLAYVVLTTPDEPLNDLIARMSVRPGVPAALHTAGHALALDADGAVAGVLTPADFARATQLGALHLGQPAR